MEQLERETGNRFPDVHSHEKERKVRVKQIARKEEYIHLQRIRRYMEIVLSFCYEASAVIKKIIIYFLFLAAH